MGAGGDIGGGSSNVDPLHQFHIGDYVVFGMAILISILIGIFYAVTGRKRTTTAEYLVGGGSMNFLPTTISLMVSFESSIMMLGLPAEVYTYGFQIFWWSVGLFISQILSVSVIVPLLHPLKITSAYEYLELRFQSRAVRLMGTLMGILTYTFYMGIVLFGPAVALEAVTGFPQWNSIFVIAAVSVVYTSIGGMKAVIWTDVFQAFVMFMGIFAILIKGTIDVGGPKRVWDIAMDGGRLNFFNFDPDPRVRQTFWNLCVGSAIRGFGLGFNQSTVQRISSTKSLRDAKRMLRLVAPCFLCTLCLACYEGIVAYSYYQSKQCDPLGSGQITNPNQIIPFIVMDIFKYLPGMPGLFLASLFSATLSTLSSGLSSLAALTWADLIHPLVGDVKQTKATIIIKFTVIVYGGLACVIAFLVGQIGGTLTQITSSIISAFSGPLTGIFFLGCFFPRTTAKGCLVGGFVSLIVCTWISMGQNFSPNMKKTPTLPDASTAQCVIHNDTSVFLSNLQQNHTLLGMVDSTTPGVLYTSAQPEEFSSGVSGVEVIYTLSFQWIAVVGIFGTIIVGNIVSLLTGMNKPGDVDPRYLISMTDSLLIFLPRAIKKRISSIGPQFMEEKYKSQFQDPAERKANVADIEMKVPIIGDEEQNGHNIKNNINNGDNGVVDTNISYSNIPSATLDLEGAKSRHNSNGDLTK